MANSYITPQMITRRFLSIFRNSNPFLMAVDRQMEDQFGNASVGGQKPGATIRIRQPVDYALRTGNIAQVQSTNDQSNVSLTVAKQIGVDMAFSQPDLTLNIVDFSERYIEPAVNTIVGGIALDIISGSEAIPQMVHSVDGSNNTITPTLTTWTQAGALLDNNSAPRGTKRNAILDPVTMARTVGAFSGLFNSVSKIGRQYNTSMIGEGVLGMDWMQDQTVIKHVTGSYVTAPTVNGANQTGTILNVSATAGTINAGDIFTIAGVFQVNRVTKVSTGQLRQFAVGGVPGTTYAAGTTSLPIYPPLNPPVVVAGLSGTAYQTVTASPANGATVTFICNSGETYRKNFIFLKEAVTLAVVPLEIPASGKGVISSHRETYDNISVSMVTFYDGVNGQEITRLDLLYGYVWQRPEFAVVVADAL